MGMWRECKNPRRIDRTQGLVESLMTQHAKTGGARWSSRLKGKGGLRDDKRREAVPTQVFNVADTSYTAEAH